MRLHETYAAAQAFQLLEWVAGRPWHNPFAPDGSYGEKRTDGECCPDFSCCVPGIAPQSQREAFANADDAARNSMLGMFLCEVVQEETGKVIHIAGEIGGTS